MSDLKAFPSTGLSWLPMVFVFTSNKSPLPSLRNVRYGITSVPFIYFIPCLLSFVKAEIILFSMISKNEQNTLTDTSTKKIYKWQTSI